MKTLLFCPKIVKKRAFFQLEYAFLQVREWKYSHYAHYSGYQLVIYHYSIDFVKYIIHKGQKRWDFVRKSSKKGPFFG